MARQSEIPPWPCVLSTSTTWVKLFPFNTTELIVIASLRIAIQHKISVLAGNVREARVVVFPPPSPNPPTTGEPFCAIAISQLHRLERVDQLQLRLKKIDLADHVAHHVSATSEN